jgi:predicted nuclease of restriction endonuclease-like (RecB) superfamily
MNHDSRKHSPMKSNKAYKAWLTEVKTKIRSTQIKASLAINSTLIEFYWDLGAMICEKQTAWGSKFIEQLSKDLGAEFPSMEGFSRSNLFNTSRFYRFYSEGQIVQQAVGLLQKKESKNISKAPSTQRKTTKEQALLSVKNAEKRIISAKKKDVQIVQQAVGQLPFQTVTQIPWGHNILIITKTQSIDEALFYIGKTLENNWSRNNLELQIEAKLYKRQGKAVNNFKSTLPKISSDLAHQLLKDPYQFDFLALTEDYKEKELENALVENITKFLLELGNGFSYVGKQVPIEFGGKEFIIDLLFYHLKLRAYVIIELKTNEFIPEYAGKLSFYLSVANDILRHPSDNPTIGILICGNKNQIVADYALKGITQPIGISEYQLTKLFPKEFKSILPTVEEIEKELKMLQKQKKEIAASSIIQKKKIAVSPKKKKKKPLPSVTIRKK